MPRFVPASTFLALLQKLRAAFDGPGANEGFELARALSGFAPITRAAAQRAHDKGVSDESGRALQDSASATGSPQEEARGAASQRRILAHRAQRRYVGSGLKMRAALASALIESGLPQQTGSWPSELSCAGSVVCTRPDCKKCLYRANARPFPGCSERERRMLMIARGITQLARRLDVWGDHECAWLLRATHSSDEVRRPESMRESVRVSGRRLVRGSPLVPESVDFSPGESTQDVVALQSDLSAHAREET